MTVYLHGVEADEDVVLNGFRSLALARDWLSVTQYEEVDGLHLYAVLPDGERIQLDHEDRWVRVVNASSHDQWLLLCRQRGLHTSPVSRTVLTDGVRVAHTYWIGRDEGGVQCAHFDSTFGHVEVRLTDEEVSRER